MDGNEEQDGEGSYGLVAASLRRVLRARCSLIHYGEGQADKSLFVAADTSRACHRAE